MFCFVLNSNSQNLVPNWSFEDTIDCTSFNINNAQHWCPVGKSPTIHGPDGTRNNFKFN